MPDLTLTTNTRAIAPKFSLGKLLLFGLVVTFLSFSGITYIKERAYSPEQTALHQAIRRGIDIQATPGFMCNHFNFLEQKKPGKWAYQLRERNFDLDRIKRILETGEKRGYIDKFGMPMMQVVDVMTGDFLIVDPTECKIFQIAPSTFFVTGGRGGAR